MKIVVTLSLFLVFIFCLSQCSQSTHLEKQLTKPTSIEELGKLLFFDSLLSRGNQVSCASCHKPEFAFSDTTALSFGVDSAKGVRNTPSAMNLSSRSFHFWDGRAETLEEQASGPIENTVEMALPLSEVVRRLNKHEQYRSFFISIFGKIADKKNVVDALAAYERTLETNNSAFDNYMTEKDTMQFSAAAKRGRIIFNEKGKCFDCHFGPDFTGDQFRNIGLFNGKELNDSGRFIVTRKPTDLGKFKTPGLRNVSITGPYMHNGMHKTLKEVIDYYNEPDKFVSNSINRDSLLKKPLHLSVKEKLDLEAFLNSLTDKQFLKN